MANNSNLYNKLNQLILNMSLKKLILSLVLFLTILTFSLSIGYFSTSVKKDTVNSSKEIANSDTKRYANTIAELFNEAMTISRTLKDTFAKTKDLPKNVRDSVNTSILRNVLESNETLLASWVHWEIRTIDPSYKKINGRLRQTMMKLNNTFKFDEVIVDTVEMSEGYALLRESKTESLTDPYEDTSTKELAGILMVSTIIPNIIDGDFSGIIGVDLSLEKIQQIIPTINPFEGSKALLIAANNSIVAHTDSEYSQKQVLDIYKDHKEEFEYALNKVRNNESYSFEIQKKENKQSYYISIAPVIVGRNKATWAIATETPLNIITKKSDDLFLITLIVGLIGIIFLSIIVYFLINSITKKLLHVVSFSEQISKGDLSTKIEISGKNEIGMLASSMNNMVNKLREIIMNIHTGSNEINDASNNLASYSKDVSNNANEQATASEEILAAIEEMGENIESNNTNAKQTESIATNALSSIKESKNSAAKAMNSMVEIESQILQIGEIAQQTNILAINAAIEAARAGEYGKGFTVVANEVKKLADRSQESAKHIENLSNSGVSIAELAEKELNELVPEIERTTTLLNNITSANLEQSNGSNQIQSSISMLSQTAQKNSVVSEELNDKAKELAEASNQLKIIIDFFKL